MKCVNDKCVSHRVGAKNGCEFKGGIKFCNSKIIEEPDYTEPARFETLPEFRVRLIKERITAYAGNKAKAARSLGISTYTLRSYMKYAKD